MFNPGTLICKMQFMFKHGWLVFQVAITFLFSVQYFNLCITYTGLNGIIICCIIAETHNYLPGLKIILDTVLETFSFRLEWCHNQAVTNKMCRVADALAGTKAEKRNMQSIYHKLQTWQDKPNPFINKHNKNILQPSSGRRHLTAGWDFFVNLCIYSNSCTLMMLCTHCTNQYCEIIVSFCIIKLGSTCFLNALRCADTKQFAEVILNIFLSESQ